MDCGYDSPDGLGRESNPAMGRYVRHCTGEVSGSAWRHAVGCDTTALLDLTDFDAFTRAGARLVVPRPYLVNPFFLLENA